MKKNIMITCVFIILFGLTSCSTNLKTLNGKYIATFDNTIFYEFSNNGTYITNDNWDLGVDSSSGSYDITDSNIFLYASGNKDYYISLGTICDNYICSVWEGYLPESYSNNTITIQLSDDFIISYTFNKNKTYEYTVISNNDIVFSESGKYSINGNKVICTNNSGTTSTFFKNNNIAYCIEYIKE